MYPLFFVQFSVQREELSFDYDISAMLSELRRNSCLQIPKLLCRDLLSASLTRALATLKKIQTRKIPKGTCNLNPSSAKKENSAHLKREKAFQV